MKKIAILGGTFDPITKGHVAIAQAVLAETDTDQVWLQPCWKHPFASKSKASNFELRHMMCLLATEHLSSAIRASDFERLMASDRKQASTYDVLLRMMKYPSFKNLEFSYIIGMDNANEFHKWVNPEEIQKLVPFIVVPRDGVEPDPKVTWYRSAPHTLLKTSVGDISSTMVREAVKSDNWVGVNEIVDFSVRLFIEEHGLYRRET